jgi:putative redox protein
LIDRTEAKGGDDRGAMGGELLLLGLGGCFMSTLLAAIRARQAPVLDVKVEVIGTLAEAPTRFAAAELRVSATCEDREELAKLVAIAERGCLVANSLRDAICLTFTVC